MKILQILRILKILPAGKRYDCLPSPISLVSVVSLISLSSALLFWVEIVSADTSSTSATVTATVNPICGNGQKEGSEQCDDGNLSNGDGCSSSCQIEYGASPAPSNPPSSSGGDQSSEQTPSGPEQPQTPTGSEESGSGGETPSGETPSGEIPSTPSSGETPSSPPSPSQRGGETTQSGGTSAPSAPSSGGGTFFGGGTPFQQIVNVVERLAEAVNPDATILENIGNVAREIGAEVKEQVVVQSQAVAKAVREVAKKTQEPAVQEANKRVAAPAAISISVAAVVPSLWSIFVPLFRFLFFQPLLLLGKRKRQAWGQVYNTLTRLPVDLAMVRLVDAKNNRVIQSRVTDKEGRYVFLVAPGEYLIEVVKQGFAFPSQLLKGAQSDGRMVDIYHGETIRAAEDGVMITPNIPLDPIGFSKTPRRIVWEGRLRIIQHVISIIGIVATIVSFVISPTWYIGGFLIAHIVLYGMFFRYIKPQKPKGWGIVYDADTKEPVGKAVARLFTKQYNKLVSAQVTDSKGHYSFLAGPSEYYVTVEKIGYAPGRVEGIMLKEGEPGLIARDIALPKATDGASVDQTPPDQQSNATQPSLSQPTQRGRSSSFPESGTQKPKPPQQSEPPSS